MISIYEAHRGRKAASVSLAGTLLAGVGAATLILSSPAAAQQLPAAQAIQADSNVTGNLRDSGPRLDDRHYDSYRLRLREGESVQVEMKSTDFDAYLDVVAPGGTDEPLKQNDDIGGGSRDSRLRFTAPASGDYLIRAQGYQGGTGAYTLSVKRRTVAPAPQPVPITAGAGASGRFGDQSPEDDEDHPYALYSFEGKEGARVRIDMVSAGLDPHLALSLHDGDYSIENDDGGEGLNARIWAVLPSTARYVLKARSLNQETGTYTVRIQQFAAAAGPPPPPAQLRREAPTLGRLAFEDSDLQMGTDDSGAVSYFYKLYALQMRAGETVTVDLKAEDFDPVLDAGIFSPLGFAVARTNDDSDGTNSRLVLTPTASGPVYIRARSLNADTMGDFTLIVTEGVASPPLPRPEARDSH